MGKNRRAKPNEVVERLLTFAESTVTPTAEDRELVLSIVWAAPAVALGDGRPRLERWVGMWSAGQLAGFREELRTLFRHLHALSDGRGGILPPPVRIERIELTPAMIGSDVLLTIDGPMMSILRFQLIDLLRVVGLGSIRTCKADDCDRLFIRSGKREYCSDRCQGRQLMRIRRRNGQDTTRKLSPRVSLSHRVRRKSS